MELKQNNIIRVITYSRFSTGRQTSKDIQCGELRSNLDATKELKQLHIKLTKDNKRIIIDEVLEEGTAAGKEGIYNPVEYMQLRPKFYEIYLRAQRKEFDELWCWNWSRLCRSFDFLPIVARMFENHGIEIKPIVGSNDGLARKIEALLYDEDLQ